MAELWDDKQVNDALDRLTDWHREGGTIVRAVELPSFPEAIDVVRAVADIAEQLNHHPDIDIRWRSVTFRCSTHSAGGITGRDFELAAKIDEVLAEATR